MDIIGNDLKIDCSACKLEGGMVATTAPKFGGFIRFIGAIIALPSVLGVVLSVMMFFASGSVAHDTMKYATTESAQAGAAIGGALTFGFSLFVFLSSLVGGLIGWLLLSKSKVFRCTRCGFIMPRS